MPKVIKKKVAKKITKKVSKVSSVKKSAKAAVKKSVKAAPASSSPDVLAFLKSASASSEKEVNQLKKQLDQLRAKHAKMTTRQKALKDKRVKAATKAKAKPSAASKTQLTNAKDAYNKISAEATLLAGEVAIARDALASLKEQTAKQAGLTKLISKFEKDWAQKGKASTAKKAAKKTVKKAVKKKAPSKKVEVQEQEAPAEA